MMKNAEGGGKAFPISDLKHIVNIFLISAKSRGTAPPQLNY